MNRREIINELQQIVALTDPNELQQIVALTDPLLASKFGPSVPEAAQRAKGLIREVKSWPPWPWSPRNEPVDASPQPADPTPPAERHIDTPDELLELLAGISSDPQVEGLSLAQKASTMALLYIAKVLQEIAESTEALLMNADFIAETLVDRSVKAKSKQKPS